MKIAILGATSQIAKDLTLSFLRSNNYQLHLFSRRTEDVLIWVEKNKISQKCSVINLDNFGEQKFDAVINFIGAGNPVAIAKLGAEILEVTQRFDQIVLDYLKKHRMCRYLFLSSGAVYGSEFSEPVRQSTSALININNLQISELYGVAKMLAECRHRASPELNIIDIRIFNYFSRTQNVDDEFLITQIFRAIRDKEIIKTSSDNIVRDYIHPSDFYLLVTALLTCESGNFSVDCFSKSPIDKFRLLEEMKNEFGLRYQVTESHTSINATGLKPNYYSLNKRAIDFGYRPKLTSLEGLLKEITAMLKVPSV
jgi:nucleoside-diphosphate-sugar epimerase